MPRAARCLRALLALGCQLRLAVAPESATLPRLRGSCIVDSGDFAVSGVSRAVSLAAARAEAAANVTCELGTSLEDRMAHPVS